MIFLFRSQRFFFCTMVFVIATLVLLTTNTLNAAAPGKTIDQYELKAAMLYNISKFVSWPEEPADNEFTNEIGVCVVGDSEITKPLLSLAFRGKKVRGKKFSVYQISSSLIPEACNVLYLSNDTSINFLSRLNLVGNRPILTVSDRKFGAELGSMINFIPQGKRIGFEVNPDEAQQSSLRFSSELLRLGIIKSTLDTKRFPEAAEDYSSIIVPKQTPELEQSEVEQ